MTAEPLTKLLLLLFGVWRKPGRSELAVAQINADRHALPLNGHWVALEPIRHEDLVLLFFVAGR